MKQRRLRASQDPQILFIEFCIKLLKPEGLLGIILPEGVFGNSNAGYVWDYLRQQGNIEAMIDCPRTTFQPGTDTKTNVLFFRTGGPQTRPPAGMQTALIASSKSCGHDRRGRTHTPAGNPLPNDFERIGASYRERDREWWSHCELHQPYYYVPRFYDRAALLGVKAYAKSFGGGAVSVDELVRAGHLHIRKGHEVGSEAYGTGNVPFVRTSDINNWEVSVDATNGLSEEIYQRYKNIQGLKSGDILLVVDGRYKIGRTAVLHEHDYRCVAQSHLRIITVAPGGPMTDYELLYVLNLPCVLEEMRNLVFVQSTLGSIGKRLGQLRIPIPQKTAEWTEKVDEFRRCLEERAARLAELQSVRNPEPEL